MKTQNTLQWVQMLVEASLQFGTEVSDYFYIAEEELDLYLNMEEVIQYNGVLIKLATMRPVKLYNKDTHTFR
jgi:hypothetical protein